MVRVPAKINLSLSVGPRADNGFHNLATVYQAVDLCDEVRVSSREDNTITVTVNSELDALEIESVPTDDSNIAVRAAKLLRDHVGYPQLGIDIAIRKVIPVAGGMAGGSADAAATLVACNEEWRLGLNRHDLEPLAAQLGSDVPFLLHGGNAMGTGHGQTVNRILGNGTFHWVCVTSHVGMSTADVYAQFDALNPRDVPEPEIPEGLLAALRTGDPHELAPMLHNDLTEAALSLRPDLTPVMDLGSQIGALATLLSGSGPTILMLADSPAHAEDLARAIRRIADVADVIVTHGPVPGARIV